MPKRKNYHKVIGGCLTCKERKVRCSLERPTCRNCSRLCRSCTYADTKIGQDALHSPRKRGLSQSNTTQEVELMHHYTANTYLTLSNNPVLVSLWKENVPKHAFKHPFLLHGLLAVAAQHKLYDCKVTNSVELIDTANLYQQKGLASYIHLLDSITEENCHALFAFSQLIAAISYSRLSLDIYEETRYPHGLIAGVIDIFDLLRGSLAIAYQASSWLRAGNLAPMMADMPKIPTPEDAFAIQSPYTKALSTLSDDIATKKSDNQGSGPKPSIESLLSTIRLLCALSLENAESADNLNKVAGFPIFVDTIYLNLLKEQDHAALTVLAYYGVILHRNCRSWALDGVGAKVVRAVTNLITDEWSMHLLWPQTEILGETSNPSSIP